MYKEQGRQTSSMEREVSVFAVAQYYGKVNHLPVRVSTMLFGQIQHSATSDYRKMDVHGFEPW